MPDLSYTTIESALSAQPLFAAKTWQLSPEAWPLTHEQVAQLGQIGSACLEFHQALETLYLWSVAGKNLLRNKPLLAVNHIEAHIYSNWVAPEGLEARSGKTASRRRKTPRN